MLQKATNAYSPLSRQRSGLIFASSADAQGACSYQNKSRKEKDMRISFPVSATRRSICGAGYQRQGVVRKPTFSS